MKRRALKAQCAPGPAQGARAAAEHSSEGPAARRRGREAGRGRCAWSCWRAGGRPQAHVSSGGAGLLCAPCALSTVGPGQHATKTPSCPAQPLPPPLRLSPWGGSAHSSGGSVRPAGSCPAGVRCARLGPGAASRGGHCAHPAAGLAPRGVWPWRRPPPRHLPVASARLQTGPRPRPRAGWWPSRGVALGACPAGLAEKTPLSPNGPEGLC